LRELRKRSEDGRFNVEGTKVTYADGWWFNVGQDPNTVEVTHQKYTPSEFAATIKERIARDIYGTAARAGLRPVASREGVASTGGHLNIGFRQVFSGNPLLVLNFILDFSNHAEIATGILVNDAYSAQALRLSAERRNKLEQLKREFLERPNMTAEDVANRYVELVLEGKTKNSALVFQDLHNPELARMEIRSSPTYRSVEDLEKATDLFLARIEYLKRFDKPLDAINESPLKDPFLMAKAFNEYLIQSGKRWEDYRTVISRHYSWYRTGPDGELIPPNLLLRAFGCATSYLRLGLY
jgi:hypothetical protein